MKTYIFVERNGNATLTLSADSDKEVLDYLASIVVLKDNWRLDEDLTEEE